MYACICTLICIRIYVFIYLYIQYRTCLFCADNSYQSHRYSTYGFPIKPIITIIIIIIIFALIVIFVFTIITASFVIFKRLPSFFVPEA